MACPTCRRTDVPDTCGAQLGETCQCCGMIVIATAENQRQEDEDRDNEEQEQSDSNN